MGRFKQVAAFLLVCFIAYMAKGFLDSGILRQIKPQTIYSQRHDIVTNEGSRIDRKYWQGCEDTEIDRETVFIACSDPSKTVWFHTMDSYALSIVLGDLSEDVLSLLDFATIVKLVATWQGGAPLLCSVRHIRLDDCSVSEQYRPSWWREVASFLERYAINLSQTVSLELRVSSGRLTSFNLIDWLRSCVPAALPRLLRFHLVTFGADSGYFGFDRVATILPRHLTQLDLFRINIPTQFQMETVNQLALMPALRSLQSINSLAHSTGASKSDISLLKEAAKVLSDIARRLQHLVFVSGQVSPVRGDVSFVDMPDCIDIGLWTDDFASTSAISRWKDDAPSLALERLLAAIPAHLRSTPPRLFREFQTSDKKPFYWSPLHYVCTSTLDVQPFLSLSLEKGWPVDIEDSEGATPLSHACDVVSFDSLVAAGADPFYRSAKNGNTVLFFSMRDDKVSIVEHILRNYVKQDGANLFVDGRGNGLLHYAWGECLNLLVDQFSSYLAPSKTNHQGQNALFSTFDVYSHMADGDRVERLLQLGVDPFEPDAEGYTVIHRWLELGGFNLSLIYADLVKTRRDLERVWVVQPPNGVPSDNITFAMRLCACDSTQEPQLNGFEATLGRILMVCTTEELNAVDSCGRTMLHYCITAKRGPAIDVLTFLLKRFERRHQLNLRAGCEPLLFTAARVGHNCPELFLLLVDVGLDINGDPYRGESLFHYAIRRTVFHRDCHAEEMAFAVLEQLLEHGADVLRSDDVSKLTPIHLLCDLAATQSNTFGRLFPFLSGRKVVVNLIVKSKDVLGTKMPTSRGDQDVVDILLAFSRDSIKYQAFILTEVIKAGDRYLSRWRRLISASHFIKVPAVKRTLQQTPNRYEDDQ